MSTFNEDFDLDFGIGATPDHDDPNVIDAEGFTVVTNNETAPMTSDDETAVDLCKQLENDLTPEQREKVAAFVPKIQLISEYVDTYGVDAQGKLNEETKKITATTKAQDLGAVGQSLATLVANLKENDPSTITFPTEPNENEFNGWLKKWTNAYEKALAAFKEQRKEALAAAAAKHSTAEKLIEAATKELRDHVLQLTCDIKTFAAIEDALKAYMLQLTMYILAGKQRLEIFKNTELPQLELAAGKAGQVSNAQQERSEAIDNANYFDKQLHNLLLSREIGAQALIMCRLIRNNARSLRQQLLAAINHSIPVWRTGMAMLYGVNNSKAALNDLKAANEYTANALKSLATQLGQATTDIARASEVGIIDMQTLAETHNTLVTTVEEVLQIQTEGAAKRREAETTLAVFKQETEKKYEQLLKQKATF